MRYDVRVNLVEARRISDSIGLPWSEFTVRYIDHYWPEAESFPLRRDKGKCVFLGDLEAGKVRTCLIHSVKPLACQDWNPSLYRSECQEGLAKYWGLTVSPSGKLKGTSQELQEFGSYVASLASSGQGKEIALR